MGGTLLCIVMAAAESFTMYVLSKFAQRHSAETYGSLVRATLGRKLTALLVVVMILHLFGSCLVYMVGKVLLARHSFRACILQNIATKEAISTNSCYGCVMITVMLMHNAKDSQLA